MSNRSYAHLAWSTIFLGVAGLIFIGGGEEILTNNGSAVTGWLAILGGLAMWGLLVFMFWLTYRSHKRQDWVNRQNHPYYAERNMKRGGFLKGAVITWAGVFVIHAVAFVAMSADALPEDLRANAFVAAVLILPLAHVVLPLVGGLLWHLIRSTATPKR